MMNLNPSAQVAIAIALSSFVLPSLAAIIPNQALYPGNQPIQSPSTLEGSSESLDSPLVDPDQDLRRSIAARDAATSPSSDSSTTTVTSLTSSACQVASTTILTGAFSITGYSEVIPLPAVTGSGWGPESSWDSVHLIKKTQISITDTAEDYCEFKCQYQCEESPAMFVDFAPTYCSCNCYDNALSSDLLVFSNVTAAGAFNLVCEQSS